MSQDFSVNLFGISRLIIGGFRERHKLAKTKKQRSGGGNSTRIHQEQRIYCTCMLPFGPEL